MRPLRDRGAEAFHARRLPGRRKEQSQVCVVCAEGVARSATNPAILYLDPRLSAFAFTAFTQGYRLKSRIRDVSSLPLSTVHGRVSSSSLSRGLEDEPRDLLGT
jgi:hypothetical protein